MKRFVLLLLVVAFLPTPEAHSQVLLQVRSQTVPSSQGYDIRKEAEEMKKLSGFIDRFIKYTQNEDWGKADEVKRTILVHMRDEIQQTKMKVREEQRRAERGESVDVYVRNEERGTETVIKNYDLKMFKRRLEEQEEIFRRLSAAHLNYLSNKWKSAKEHEQLMLRFEDTLKEEIRQLKEGY